MASAMCGRYSKDELMERAETLWLEQKRKVKVADGKATLWIREALEGGQ
jgi:hypothetical protein